ncbi:GntR family transcriptional regulator [Rhizobium binxianense]
MRSGKPCSNCRAKVSSSYRRTRGDRPVDRRSPDPQHLRNRRGPGRHPANRSARAATPSQIDQLYEIQTRMEEAAAAGRNADRADCNAEFHTYLGTISGNLEAIDIRRRHHDLIRTIRQKYGYSPQRIEEIHVEHRAIIEAIAKEDPKAARLHCIRSCDDMLARYRLPHAEASTGEDDASP